MDTVAQVREQLIRTLGWEEAHTGFANSVKNLHPENRGKRPTGSPHSVWELVEHIRLTQLDIVDFCRNPEYEERSWPEDYWPQTPAPPTDGAWNESIAQVQRDMTEFQQFIADPSLDLFAKIPHGSGQTYIREALLIFDHNAYHVGQIVLTRRLLSDWTPRT